MAVFGNTHLPTVLEGGSEDEKCGVNESELQEDDSGPSSHSESLPNEEHYGKHYCGVCKEHFSKRKSLFRHYKSAKHLRNVGGAPAPRLKCESCEQTFGRNDDRLKHAQKKHARVVGITIGEPRIITEISPSHQQEVADVRFDPQLDYSTLSHWPTHVDFEYTTPGGGADLEGCNFNLFMLDATTWPEDKQVHQNEDMEQRDVPCEQDVLDVKEHREDARLATEEQLRTLTLPFRNNTSVILMRGKLKDAISQTKHFCSLCELAFEESDGDLHRHLQRHLAELDERNGKHYCETCEVGFLHRNDLDWHHRCADKGDCGFGFRRAHACTGHHPPLVPDAGGEDRDYFRYNVRLMEWEHSRLQAFRSKVPGLITSHEVRRRLVRSIEVCARLSRASLASVPISITSFASLPIQLEKRGRNEVHGLQQRFRKLSLRKRGRAFAHNITGGAGDVIKALRNDALLDAVEQDHYAKAETQLRLGADPNLMTSGGLFIIEVAARFERWEHLKLLIEHGANIDLGVWEHGSIVAEVVSKRSTATADVPAELLLRRGASVNDGSSGYGSPLNIAAYYCRLSAVEVLLEFGADVNQPGGICGNPLCNLAGGYMGEWAPELCRFLVEAGADLTASGPYGPRWNWPSGNTLIRPL